MQYKLIDILKNDTKNKILYVILLVILCLFIIVQFVELTKFVHNYSYFFDYGKSLKDICLSSYTEYETSRFQVAMNLDNIKVQSDNFSKNSIYDIIILMMALCISLFSSFVLELMLLQGTNTNLSLLKEIWNGTGFIEIASKIFKFFLMFILTLYVVAIPSIYFILKLSDTADISPFQVEAAQISLHLIAILAIAIILIVWHIYFYEDGMASLFTKLILILIFCLYSYVFIRITDNYSRDKHNNDLKYYDEVDNVISDYFKNIVGLSDITSVPLYTQKNTIFILGIIIIGLVFIWLLYKYIIIRYFEIHKILPNVFKDEDTDILYYMIIPLIVILVIIFVCTANQEYNTNINKYVLYQPAKIYKQNVANINKIFNQILENDKSSIENKSVCRNFANAIHLAIYSTIFDQVKAQIQANKIEDETLKNAFTNEAVKKLFIPKFAYIRTCDDSDNTNYNDMPEYSLDYYINNRSNIFFDDNKQCNTISNKMLISVMINCIPNPTKNTNNINVNNLNIETFKNYLMFAITNIQKGSIYDGTKDLEYSNNYENNNNIASLKDESNSIADKHLNTVINSISEIYKTYLLTMYTQTLTTLNAICKCNGVEDITGVTEYNKLTEKLIKEVTYNTNAYTSNLKREYITIFLNKTKEFLAKVNAIMSSEIVTNDKNYKLAKMVISNYNILHESSKFKHFPLYSEPNQTDTENLTKEYFKDIEKIQEILDKIHASVLSKQSYATVVYDKLVAEYQRYINIFAIVNTQSSDYFEQLLFSYKKKYIDEYINLYNPKSDTLKNILSKVEGITEYTTKFDKIKNDYIAKYSNVWKLSNNVFKNELTSSNTDYRADSTEANTRANDASLSSYILIVIYLIGIALSYIIV